MTWRNRVGRIANPSRNHGRINNPSYGQTRKLFRPLTCSSGRSSSPFRSCCTVPESPASTTGGAIASVQLSPFRLPVERSAYRCNTRGVEVAGRGRCRCRWESSEFVITKSKAWSLAIRNASLAFIASATSNPALPSSNSKTERCTGLLLTTSACLHCGLRRAMASTGPGQATEGHSPQRSIAYKEAKEIAYLKPAFSGCHRSLPVNIIQ